MKTQLKYGVFSLLFCVSVTAFTQPLPEAGEMLSYLKKNIRVWVLHDPNTVNPDFKKVSTEAIFADTDGIILGSTSNNGMDICAKLLSALFKDPSKRSDPGDMILQRVVYQLMELVDKPIDLRLVNDVAKPLDAKYAAQFGFYTLVRWDVNGVFPGAFRPGQIQNSAGDIVIGESNMNVRHAKYILVNMIAKVCLQNFNMASSMKMLDIENQDPPALMYKTNNLPTIFPANDIRNAVPEAIAYSMTFVADSNRELRRAYSDQWLSDTPYIVVPGKESLGYGVAVNKDVPEAFTLDYIIRKAVASRVDNGYDLANLQFFPYPERVKGWKIYNFYSLPRQVVIQNEIVLGLLCYEFINIIGTRWFLKFVAHDNKRLWQTSPQNRLAVLIENLCVGILEGKTLEAFKAADPKKKNYLFGLALVDMFLDFPDQDAIRTEFPTYKRTFFGVFPEDVFSQTILNEYFDLRAQIITVARQYNTKPGVPVLLSGEINYSRVNEGIWRFLQKIP